MAHAFLADRVVSGDGVARAAVLLEENGETIRAVCSPGDLPAGCDVIDLGRLALLPGLIDSHVHINEPGRTEWEGFATATRAAAAGGFTTLVDMPLNCLPETANVAALELKRQAAAGKCLVDWAAWGGAVADNQADILPLARAGVCGFKCFLIYPGCDGFTMVDRQQLERSLPAIAASGLPLLVHAELAAPIEAALAALREADWTRFSTYLASRPDAAEIDAIRMMIELCRRNRFRLHIVHVSSADALPLLAEARAEGLPVSAETCPHYLHFAAEEVADGDTLLKCAPPIRSAANRERLWDGLRSGTLSLIATDHSPCPPEMKRLEEGRFDLAWGGIASLSLALSATWTGACTRGFSLADLVRWMASAPAALAGLDDRVGSIRPGRCANLVAFDPEATFPVTPDRLYFRHAVTPYLGASLRGVVRSTWLRGQLVFRDGVFSEQLRGRELALC